MKTKICSNSSCKTEYPATTEYFNCDKNRNNGLYPLCKECRKKYYQDNKEQLIEEQKEYNKEYRQKNKEQIRKYQKEYYQKNKEQILENQKEYYQENREKRLEYNKGRKQKPALYDDYIHRLEWCEEVRRNKDDFNILEVICTKCKKWFIPTNQQIKNRIQAINGKERGNTENRFYCSDKCKNVCDIYGKKPTTLMKNHAIRSGRIPWHYLQRKVQPELREMVLERDDYTCQKCESKDSLECHHIKPVAYDPIESADMDICVTLCEDCHKKVHQLSGCTIGEIRENSVLQECYG